SEIPIIAMRAESKETTQQTAIMPAAREFSLSQFSSSITLKACHKVQPERIQRTGHAAISSFGMVGPQMPTPPVKSTTSVKRVEAVASQAARFTASERSTRRLSLICQAGSCCFSGSQTLLLVLYNLP